MGQYHTKKEEKIKRLTKQPVNIESEFIGVPVGPKKPKEKKNDTTKDLEILLKQPMSVDLIKHIIMRMEGYRQCTEKDIIKIYALQGYRKEHDNFIIIIYPHKSCFPNRYFLCSMSLHHFRSFRCEEMDSSPLKSMIRHEIYKWLCDNPDKVIRVG
jgi:hypothetical protein